MAAAILVIFERDRRWRYALAFIGAAILAIAPVTVRNAVLYKRFIPLSIGAGITLIEGIADYDKEGRFALPQFDEDVKAKDAEWHNRPDYAKNLWYPDGVERDRYRFSRGLAIVREEPLWFLSVIARRAGTMLRSNDALQLGWPADTALAPLVGTSVPSGHTAVNADDKPPVWSRFATDLFRHGERLAAGAEQSFTEDGKVLRIVTAESGATALFASESFSVQPNTDYVLRLVARVEQPPVLIEAGSVDRRFTLGALLVNRLTARRKEDEAQNPAFLELPFASGNREQARIILHSNGGTGAAIELGETQLYEVGATPYQWTRPLRSIVRRGQKDIFKTGRLLLLIVLGISFLVLAKRYRALLLYLTVPLYYLLVQSVFHTEYRYILPLHYFLFVMAATTLYLAGLATVTGLARWWRHHRRRKTFSEAASPGL